MPSKGFRREFAPDLSEALHRYRESSKVAVEFVFENLDDNNLQMEYLGVGSAYTRRFRGGGSVTMTFRGAFGVWSAEVEYREHGMTHSFRTPLYPSLRTAAVATVSELGVRYGQAWARKVEYTYSQNGVLPDIDDSTWLESLMYDAVPVAPQDPIDVLTDAFVHFARRENPHWKVNRALLIRENGHWCVGVQELGAEVTGATDKTPQGALRKAIAHLSAKRTARGAFDAVDARMMALVQAVKL